MTNGYWFATSSGETGARSYESYYNSSNGGACGRCFGNGAAIRWRNCSAKIYRLTGLTCRNGAEFGRKEPTD